MSSSSLTKCGICQRDFNEEERCPRTLPCSHYFCSECIKNMIIRDLKYCPFCGSIFEATVCEDIMINRAVIDFLKYLPLHGTNHDSNFTPLAERIANMEREIVESTSSILTACDNAKEDAKVTLDKTETMLQDLKKENARIDEEILPNIMKIKEQNANKQNDLEKQRQKMNFRLEEILDKQKKLNDIDTRIDKTSSFQEVVSLMDEAKLVNKAVGEWTEYYKILMTEDLARIELAKEEVQEARAKLDKTTECLRFLWEEDREEKEGPPVQENNKSKQIMVEELQQMSERVKCLIDQGKVYAVQKQKGVTRSARISITDKKLCLHHLSKKSPLADAYTVNHQDILHMVDPSSRLTFLELGDRGTPLGRLTIRLEPNTNGATQFALLCSGQLGPSYIDTNLLSVVKNGNIGEHALFGDYEYNTGKGGRALLPGLCWKSEYERPDQNGTLTGVGWYTQRESIAAQFAIRTKGISGKMCNAAFGIVEEGLHILTEAIKARPNVKELSIMDCGLILPS